MEMSSTVGPAGERVRAPLDWTPSSPVVHSCHHKVGTVWFGGVLRHVAEVTGAPFARIQRGGPTGTLGIGFHLDPHSSLCADPATDLRGSHMVRDPRDVVVSGYGYHLWSSEKWLHVPDPEYRGMSYQQRLRELPLEEGLAVEIRRSRNLFRRMREWNYDDDRIIELRYEDAFGNDEQLWTGLMTHWGMTGPDLERGVEIGVFHSYQNVKARAAASGEEKKHLSKGTPLQWQEKFTPALIELIEAEAGDLITALGYR
jgi:hypothetical protein